MTISSTVRKAGPFAGHGTTSEFPFEFKVFSAEDLYVVQYNEATNLETVLALDANYTVTLNADQNEDPGGIVELTSNLPTGYTLTITSDIGNLQPTDLTNRGGFYPSVINDALDRSCIQIQQLAEDVSRSVKVALSSEINVDLPHPTANELIGWDATATNLVNIDPSTIATVVAYATAYADTFEADGVTTDWVLTRNPAVLYNLDVSIAGVTQVPVTDYTLSGKTFSTTSPAPAGAIILVKYKEGLPNYEGDAQDVRYVPSGTGAVETNVAAKLSETVSVKDFGAVGDGITDDTAAIQAAIDYGTSLAGIVEIAFGAGKTYLTGGLIPKSGVRLNLNGSTLYLKDSALKPVFFDGGSYATLKENFGVSNGTLDCNQDNNNGLNVLGGIWLTNWSGLWFESLTITNCPRSGLNFVACSFLTVKDYTFINSGMGIPSGYYAYALSIDAGSGTSKFISIDNLSVSNVSGYGIHFYKCQDFTANNLYFDTLDYTSSIAITFTEAKRGRVSNVIVNSTTGDSIEINDCANVILENTVVDGAGIRALLVGRNNPLVPYNSNITVTNFTSTNTVGSFAAALSNCTDSTFEGLVLDKKVTYDPAATLSARNTVRNSTIADTVANCYPLFYYAKFSLRDVVFSDYKVSLADSGVYEVVVNPTIANGATYDLPMASIAPGFFTLFGVATGTLSVYSAFTGSTTNQGSYQKCEFLVNNAGTAANLSTVTTVNNAAARAVTISGDAANKKITLTNSTGVEIAATVKMSFLTNRI